MLYDLIMYHCDINAEQRKSDEQWLLEEVLGYNANEADKILSKDEQMIAINLTSEQVHKIIPPFDAHGSVIISFKNGTSDYVSSFVNGAVLVFYKHEPDSSFYAKDIDGYNPNIYEQSKKSHYYDHPVIGAENRVDLTKQPKPISIQSLRTESIFPKNVPKCPTCQSTNIKKVSTTSKAINTVMFGLLGTKRHKTFHCNDCEYEW